MRKIEPSIFNENQYWNEKYKIQTVKLLPGDYYVSANNEMIVTLLGSCVSACIRDRQTLVGGMNHFTLPCLQSNYKSPKRLEYEALVEYGSLVMSQLIDEILQKGGKRENLEAKIFGGADMGSFSKYDLGKYNVMFLKKYLLEQDIPVLSTDIGDTWSRKVYFVPSTGDAYVKKIERKNNQKVFDREILYSDKI